MRNILAAVDFSDVTPAVARTAAEMAAAPTPHRLYVLHVDATDSIDIGFDLESAVGREELAGLLRAEHRALLALGEELRTQGVDAATLLRRCEPGDEAKTILKEAERLQPDLIVIGSHGHGALHDLLLGGVSTGVLRSARCSVLIVPSRPDAKE